MRAAVYHGRQDLRLEEVPEPVAGPGEVKLKVLYNGICGSDLHEYYDGPITTRATTPHPLTGVKNPVILGHELCGEVVDVGDGVEDLARGDRVAVEPVETSTLQVGDAGLPRYARDAGCQRYRKNCRCCQGETVAPNEFAGSILQCATTRAYRATVEMGLHVSG